ncbi:MAG: DNA-directed DNA polymerase [Candidatus Micrarchaeia archaeon]
MGSLELAGIILDVDYLVENERGVIRVTLKQGGKAYTLYDYSFFPYFYLLPSNEKVSEEMLARVEVPVDSGVVKARGIERKRLIVGSSEREVFKIYADSPRNIPKFSDAFSEFGTPYEDDVVFWKRYIIDKGISPLEGVSASVHEENGRLLIDKLERASAAPEYSLNHISFDIETYNPTGMPRPERDPIIMISYTDGVKHGVLTTKKIEKDFVSVVENERELIKTFVNVIKDINPDLIVGYNSSVFDIPYMMERAGKLRVEFGIGRNGEPAKKEHHGLIEAVRIPGRINLDVYNVAKFVSVVGASEKLIKVNSFKLLEVYQTITGKKKLLVEKPDIWKMWDNGGSELEELSEYSLDDSLSLDELYNFFLPLEIEVAKVSGTTLGEAAISTTGQLVEHILMSYASAYGQIIPNKPTESETKARLENPIVGAYVKEPEAGIYDKLVVFDFRGLYPSIIISHNIDPSTICDDCSDAFVAPNGIKFRKDRPGIMPIVLKKLLDERKEVKKQYKQNPDNKELGARSTALKILANSFYGYLGYARSRWYSRECASSVTAYGRLFISKTMEEAEKSGFKVLYGDTDSVFLLMGDKSKEDTLALLKRINSGLPESMELELEDFYTRGVFVGKKGEGGGGAKKKYALISESGRIKIRGFELVRRDWAKIARDTQMAVLEAILKDGSKEKAIEIVRSTIARLRSGNVDLKDLVIHTQLRKGISGYDVKSPELGAAKKAIAKGIKRADELEGSAIGYVITKNGSSISEKAELLEMADSYDPDYYINHQLLPATMRILKELGYNAEELKSNGTQKKLM